MSLPVHPHTGLTAIGVLPSGRIVWPIQGGNGATNPTPTPAPAPAPTPQQPAPPAAPTPPPVPPAPAPAAPAAQPAPVPTPPAPLPTPPPTPEPPAPEPRDISGLPRWAQDEIGNLRGEAADRRIAARTETVLRHAFAAAGEHGVNGHALLGSTAFAAVAKQLDPNTPEFPAALATAVTSTLQANPWMAAQQAAPAQPGQAPAPRGGSEPSGRPGAPGKAANLTDAITSRLNGA